MTSPIEPTETQIPANNPTSIEWWQTMLDRLRTRIEDVSAGLATTIETLGEDATAEALALVAESVGPHIDGLTAQVAALVADVNEAADTLAALQSGGVLAVNVTVAAGSGLDAGNVQLALAELVGDINAVAGSLATLATTVGAIDDYPAAAILASANAMLVAGKAYRLVTAGITLTLPATPATGAAVRIIDGGVIGAGATATVARNGKTIMGLSENLIIDVPGIDAVIWYDGSTWRLA